MGRIILQSVFPVYKAPIGVLTACVALLVPLIIVIVFLSIICIACLIGKKDGNKRNMVIGVVLFGLAFSPVGIMCTVQIIKATRDIVEEGSVEVIVENVEFTKTHGTGRAPDHYYLVCETEEGEKLKVTTSKKASKKYEELVEEAEEEGIDRFELTYFENLKIVVDLDEYD